MSAEIKKVVEEFIAKNKVMIFSKSYCPYCVKVKKLFDKLAVPYCAVELDSHNKGGEIQQQLISLTNQQTVPNVFVNGVHVGGCDDTHSAQANGTLSKLLGKQ